MKKKRFVTIVTSVLMAFTLILAPIVSSTIQDGNLLNTEKVTLTGGPDPWD
jgi:hypothetical protein